MTVHLPVPLLAGGVEILSTRGVPSSSFAARMCPVISMRKLSSSPWFHYAEDSVHPVGAECRGLSRISW